MSQGIPLIKKSLVYLIVGVSVFLFVGDNQRLQAGARLIAPGAKERPRAEQTVRQSPLEALGSGDIDPETFPWHLVRPPEASHRLPTPVFNFHPVYVTMLVLFAILAAVCWASDEWDWARLVEDDESDKPR